MATLDVFMSDPSIICANAATQTAFINPNKQEIALSLATGRAVSIAPERVQALRRDTGYSKILPITGVTLTDINPHIHFEGQSCSTNDVPSRFKASVVGKKAPVTVPFISHSLNSFMECDYIREGWTDSVARVHNLVENCTMYDIALDACKSIPDYSGHTSSYSAEATAEALVTRRGFIPLLQSVRELGLFNTPVNLPNQRGLVDALAQIYFTRMGSDVYMTYGSRVCYLDRYLPGASTESSNELYYSHSDVHGGDLGTLVNESRKTTTITDAIRTEFISTLLQGMN